MLKKKTAVYLGSFDPITLGHLDIIERGAQIFDELIVGVGKHQTKNFCFSAEQRLEMTSESCLEIKGVTVKELKGLAVHFAQENDACVIIRGLRTEADYVYEMQMAMINKTLSSALETIFIPTRQSLCHISSSLVKEVAQFGGDISKFVPKVVAKKLLDRFT